LVEDCVLEAGEHVSGQPYDVRKIPPDPFDDAMAD